MLELQEQDETIDIKLWGEAASSFTYTEGERVKFANVKVDHYSRGDHNTTTLDSTDLLTVTAVKATTEVGKPINIWGIMKNQ